MVQHLNSHISVRTYDKSFEGGRIHDSRKPRVTEIEALQRMAFGDPIPATDTIGEALRAGKRRCPRCNQFQEQACFATWTDKKTGKTYQKTHCNSCRYKIEKATHMSQLESLNPYPARIG